MHGPHRRVRVHVPRGERTEGPARHQAAHLPHAHPSLQQMPNADGSEAGSLLRVDQAPTPSPPEAKRGEAGEREAGRAETCSPQSCQCS